MRRIQVADFFCGGGGTSAGFRHAGLQPAVGIDSDPDAAKTFKANFTSAHFLETDIRDLHADEVSPFLDHRQLRLFCGCAPCQPWSKQNGHRRQRDGRTDLLLEFGRFVDWHRPELVFVENVPGLQNPKQANGPLARFLSLLDAAGYSTHVGVVNALQYGVPQYRRRLVVLASLLGPIDMPQPTHGAGPDLQPYATVRDHISWLPALGAGEDHPDVSHHRAMNLSEQNRRRIRATPISGGRLHWPASLQLECHANGHEGHTDVYGRMHWDRPAPCLTTKCISLSNGRFGHPTQDRAISVREAACLQTFPRDFGFSGNLASMARQIGNAVPVLLAERVGHAFCQHVEARSTASQSAHRPLPLMAV
jgi:DNA (cytosine-5)-methyltransferase 1